MSSEMLLEYFLNFYGHSIFFNLVSYQWHMRKKKKSEHNGRRWHPQRQFLVSAASGTQAALSSRPPGHPTCRRFFPRRRRRVLRLPFRLAVAERARVLALRVRQVLPHPDEDLR